MATPYVSARAATTAPTLPDAMALQYTIASQTSAGVIVIFSLDRRVIPCRQEALKRSRSAGLNEPFEHARQGLCCRCHGKDESGEFGVVEVDAPVLYCLTPYKPQDCCETGRRRRNRSRQRKAGGGEGGDCLLRGSIGFHGAGLIEAVRGGDQGGVSPALMVNGGKNWVAPCGA